MLPPWFFGNVSIAGCCRAVRQRALWREGRADRPPPIGPGGLQSAERRASLPRRNAQNDGAVPVSTPPLKPLGLMQVLAPLLAVLLAVVVALLAAWALSLPAPA